MDLKSILLGNEAKPKTLPWGSITLTSRISKINFLLIGGDKHRKSNFLWALESTRGTKEFSEMIVIFHSFTKLLVTRVHIIKFEGFPALHEPGNHFSVLITNKK